jgi:hypothetical protein
VLKTVSDGTRIEFDRGKFDDWCVYSARPGEARYAPRDVEYFSTLKQLHECHPRVHDDFIDVFVRTGPTIDAGVLEFISEIAMRYPNDIRTEVEILLVTFYAAMIAEENRAHAPLGKRIKRLGVHQVLVDGMPPEHAAVFSRGKPWRELDEHCRARGF